jgi:hypothetical protein
MGSFLKIGVDYYTVICQIFNLLVSCIQQENLNVFSIYTNIDLYESDLWSGPILSSGHGLYKVYLHVKYLSCGHLGILVPQEDLMYFL